MTFKIIDNEYSAKIKVVGVGGAGGNAINRMVASGMHGVEFIAVNTDSQVLETSSADACLCIGENEFGVGRQGLRVDGLNEDRVGHRVESGVGSDRPI